MLDDHPVNERDLPRVTISPQKLEEWRQLAHEEVTWTLRHRQSWYFQFHEKTQDYGYELIADKPNLQAFARSVPNNPHLKNVLMRASLETTLDAIMFGLYCETTREQRCAFAHLYEDSFLDGGILHTGATRTKEDPFRFVGIKWVAFRSPAPTIVTSRDFIYFAYSGTTRDANGQRVLYRVLRTMPLDGVDVIERKHNKLVRGHISYVYLYRENGTRTEVSVQALHSTAGSMPSWVVTKTIAFAWPGIFNLVTLAEARMLMMMGLTKRVDQGGAMGSLGGSGAADVHKSHFSKSAAMASTHACGVCYRRFRMMRARRICKGCFRPVCKSCTVKLAFFDEYKERSDTGVTYMRFCLNCMVKARAARHEHNAQFHMESSHDSIGDQSVINYTMYESASKHQYLDDWIDDDDDLDIDNMDLLDLHDHDHDGSYKDMHVDDDNYSIGGESYTGTSILSSNLDILSPTGMTGSSLPMPLPSVSQDSVGSNLHLKQRQHSAPDLVAYGKQYRGIRPANQVLKKSMSLKKHESADLEQTFRLRMQLFPEIAQREELDAM